jgi:uncharacterized metal-binding protein
LHDKFSCSLASGQAKLINLVAVALQQLFGSAAFSAVAAHFQPADYNMKTAFALDLALEPVK